MKKVLLRGRRQGSKTSPFVETERLGRVLTLDGVVQTTEADEFIYHEMLTHVPLFAHGAAKRVLVIGGGDGGMLREIVKHKEVEKITLVEIDKGVDRVSRRSICRSSRTARSTTSGSKSRSKTARAMSAASNARPST